MIRFDDKAWGRTFPGGRRTNEEEEKKKKRRGEEEVEEWVHCCDGGNFMRVIKCQMESIDGGMETFLHINFDLFCIDCTYCLYQYRT